MGSSLQARLARRHIIVCGAIIYITVIIDMTMFCPSPLLVVAPTFQDVDGFGPLKMLIESLDKGFAIHTASVEDLIHSFAYLFEHSEELVDLGLQLRDLFFITCLLG